ncbi:MAG: periplasmic protein TonB [Alphaproteobacteria bacterium]|nr:periplasmic protein TonB [Alphaproteobacteria bacterium]
MGSAGTLAVIDGAAAPGRSGRGLRYSPLIRDLNYSAPVSPFLRAAAATGLAHIGALAWMVYSSEAVAPPPPAVSFSVTLMDLSSSSPDVAQPSSSKPVPSPAVPPDTKPAPEKTVEIKPVARAVKVAKAVAPAAPAPKTSPSPVTNLQLSQSHNAIARAAVLAPVTPAQFDAAYLQNPRPAYPGLSRRLGEQGNVLLAVHVTTDGKPETVILKQSSGFARLDDAALESVRRWRFLPARRGDQLVVTWVHVPVQFILEQ